MVESDIQAITEAELAQGWRVEAAKQEMRFRDQQEGRSIALIAEQDDAIAGYINFYREGMDCRNDDDLVLYLSKQLH